VIDKTAFFQELVKIGAVSEEQARSSLDRLNTLERNKPTLKQVGRYAGVGAVAGPAMSLVGNVIKKGPKGALDFGGKTVLRGALGDAAKGAIGGGLVPLARNQLDRRGEINTLKSFVQEHQLPPAAPGPAGTEVGGKIAAAPSQQVQQPQEQPENNGRKVLLGLAGGVGGGVANAGLNQLVTRASMNAPEEDKALLGRIRSSATVPVHDVGPGHVASFASPELVNEQGMQQLNQHLGKPLGPEGAVMLGRDVHSPGVLAHELGHADINASRSGRVLQNKHTLRAGLGASAIGSLTGAVTGLSGNKTVQHLGLAAPALAALPQLAYEAGASLKGIRHMRNAGATRAQLGRMAKAVIPAWGTYATNAGMGVANAAVTQGITGGIRNAVNESNQG
jgi:hypothetical protein